MSLLTRTTRHRAVENGAYDPTLMFNRGLVAQTGHIPEGTILLQDVWPLIVKDTKKIVSEGVAGGAPAIRVTGVFQVADDTNANGRVYPRPILREAVEAIQEDITNRSVWGEYDHPCDAKIHLDRVSHLITKIWMEGKSVFGEAEIIRELPYGSQLNTLLNKGRIGISSRGIGDMEVRDNGGQELYFVTEGYRFVTWDAVAEPSVTGAILQLCEGKLRPIKRFTAPVVKPAPKPVYERMLCQEIEAFLDNQ